MATYATALTRGSKFVTARHTLQALVIERLAERFRDCVAEKNCTLIRYDILQSLRKLYDELGDEAIWAKAAEMVPTEHNSAYRQKYGSLWR